MRSCENSNQEIFVFGLFDPIFAQAELCWVISVKTSTCILTKWDSCPRGRELYCWPPSLYKMKFSFRFLGCQHKRPYWSTLFIGSWAFSIITFLLVMSILSSRLSWQKQFATNLSCVHCGDSQFNCCCFPYKRIIFQISVAIESVLWDWK